LLEKVNEQGNVVIMGSQEALQAANAERGDWLKIHKLL